MVKLLFLLVPALISGVFNVNQIQTQEIKIYDENCNPAYKLVYYKDRGKLVSVENNKVIEIYEKGTCPYLKYNSKYNVYVNNEIKYGHKHLAVLSNELYDLDTKTEINKASKRMNGDIFDSLEYITYDDIPVSEAKLCDCHYYFKHLQDEEFGNNTAKTCTIVAAQILTDYYDSIYNEDIIEDKYDDNKREHFNDCQYFPSSPGSKGEEFHSYLLKLCNGYCDTNVEEKGLSTKNQINFMNYYIGEVRNIEYKYNSSEGNWSDIFSGRQFGIVNTALNEGRPVILNNLNHSMVAFGYDSNYYYLMTGWQGYDFEKNKPYKMARMKLGDFNGNIFNNYCGAYDLVLNNDKKGAKSYYSLLENQYLNPWEAA